MSQPSEFSEVYCQNNLTAEKCVATAKQDIMIAKSVGIDIYGDYKSNLDDGDCPCRAAWGAKYRHAYALGKV